MPAEVMESDTSILVAAGNPEDAKRPTLSMSGPMLSRVSSAPEPIRPRGQFETSGEHDLRKRTPHPVDQPLDQPYPGSLTEASSPTEISAWSVRGSSPHEHMAERPQKRARVEYKADAKQDAGTVQLLEPYSTQYRHPRPDDELYSRTRRPDRGPVDADPGGVCANCSGTDAMVMAIVRGLLELQADITHAFSIPSGGPSPIEEIGGEVTKQGLRHGLAWAVNEIRNTSRMLQGAAGTKPGLPPLADLVPRPHVNDMRRPSVSGQSPTALNDPWRMPLPPDSGRNDDYYRRGPEQRSDQMLRPWEPTLSSLMSPDEMKRSQVFEQTPMGGPPQSSPSHPSSSSSVFGSGQSPMQSQPSARTLPSPPGAAFPGSRSAGPAPYSPTTATHAVQTTHLQDLQHQISTKTLALQTLQREHDQLLAAFSRSQIRCNALDKKSQVSDHEINTLTEEKIRLQRQVQSLEEQVDDLAKSRDEVHKQSTSDSAQWRQIMAMSSQLQLKGADEARRYKTERDAWEREQAALQARIEELESSRVIRAAHPGPASGSTTSEASDDVLASASLEELRQEVVRLRQRCAEMEATLQDLVGETEQIDHAISAMEHVRRRLTRKTRRAEDDS